MPEHLSPPCGPWVMCDHDDGLSQFSIEALHQIQNLLG